MSTNMSSQQPPAAPQQQPDSPSANAGYPPAFGKAADQASSALASMFKICHQQDPNSPLCDALQNMIKAVAEVESRAGMATGPEAGNPDMESPADNASEPYGEPPPSQDVPMSGNPSMAKAANEAFAMMQAKKRPQGA